MFERRSRWSGMKILSLVIATSIITGALILFGIPKVIGKYQKPINDQNINYNSQNNIGSQVAQENTGDTLVTKAIADVMSSVVGISTVTLGKNEIFDSGGAGKWGVGSGVIVSENGYIITNYHVAGGKSKILVTLENGEVVDGKNIWGDPVLDLAMVKIDGKGLPIAKLGDNSKLKVGDIAIAIGNPLGLQFQRTVTSGVISGLNRTIAVDTEIGQNYMEDLIQTDALINPGNSGGPLLNANGEIIGINTIKITTAEGMGFAIPINIVKPIAMNFAKDGKYTEPHIGIYAYDRNVMNYIDNSINLDKGIYVATIDKTGPASKSGIKEGDIITHIDNVEVNTMLDFRTNMYSKGIGKEVTLNYYSDGNPKTTKLILEKKPSNSELTR